MPACVTHYYFAEDVLSELDNDMKNNINKTAFYWGAQGPDFLFCHRYFPWMKGRSLIEYGYKIHENKPSKIFEAMRDFLKNHDDPVYRSYIYGFCCHYALDSTAHPYVNVFADELNKDREYETQQTLHGEIEGSLDTIILRNRDGKLPTEINLKRFFPKNEAIQRKIAKVIKYVIFSAFNVEIDENEVFRATNDAHFVFAALTDRTTLKKKLFDLIEKGKPHLVSSHLLPLTETADIDYANIQKNEWIADNISSDDSFFELFDKSVLLGTDLISDFNFCNFAEITQEKPFG